MTETTEPNPSSPVTQRTTTLVQLGEEPPRNPDAKEERAIAAARYLASILQPQMHEANCQYTRFHLDNVSQGGRPEDCITILVARGVVGSIGIDLYSAILDLACGEPGRALHTITSSLDRASTMVDAFQAAQAAKGQQQDGRANE